MRIANVVPGPVSRGPMGAGETRLCEVLVNGWACSGTQVGAVDVPRDPVSIEPAFGDPRSA